MADKINIFSKYLWFNDCLKSKIFLFFRYISFFFEIFLSYISFFLFLA